MGEAGETPWPRGAHTGGALSLIHISEANAECGMGQRRVLSDTRDKRHDLGDACLVVRAQQRGAIAADQVLTLSLIHISRKQVA